MVKKKVWITAKFSLTRVDSFIFKKTQLNEQIKKEKQKCSSKRYRNSCKIKAISIDQCLKDEETINKRLKVKQIACENAIKDEVSWLVNSGLANKAYLRHLIINNGNDLSYTAKCLNEISIKQDEIDEEIPINKFHELFDQSLIFNSNVLNDPDFETLHYTDTTLIIEET